MPTPSEKKALVFFGAIALLGVGVRVERARRPAPQATPAERAALQRQISRVDSVRRERHAGKRSTARAADTNTAPPPPQPRVTSTAQRISATAGPVDLDRASSAELERLPRIGPRLAATIVADREKLGPFGSLKGLERVRGIGPAMAHQLDTLVTFSGVARPLSLAPPKKSRKMPRDGRY